METLLSRSAWAKISFFHKKWHFFLLQNVFISIFWLEFEISASELTPVPNFSSIGRKIKGTRILTWNNTKNGLMTSYLQSNDNVSNFLRLLRNFVPEYHHAKFDCNWTTNKGETEGKTPA